MRPELDNGLIPTTWKAPAASIWGQIIEGLNYQFKSARLWKILVVISISVQMPTPFRCSQLAMHPASTASTLWVFQRRFWAVSASLATILATHFV
jgi:hypothetical protein